MKGKSRSRLVKSILNSGWASLLGNIILIILFLIFTVRVISVVEPETALVMRKSAEEAMNAEGAGFWTRILNMPFLALYTRVFAEALKDGVAVSVIIVDIVILWVSRTRNRIDSTLEEEIKSNGDHHAIIEKYSAYKDAYGLNLENNDNYFSENGEKLLCWRYLRTEALDTLNLDKIILKEYFHYAGKKNVDVKKAKESIDRYINGNEAEGVPRGIVKIPDVCLFVNNEGAKGNLKIIFQDEPSQHELPDFIESHAADIMSAHKTSKSENKLTVRLKGLDYDKDNKLLILKTERTNYIHMMLTNRCMDFPIGDGLSVRSLYEYRDYVQPLNATILGNQIGVEGLIITNDGYTLIEKRNSKYKTTWRNKFAQPISLSMSCKDLGISSSGQILEMDEKKASEAIGKMLAKHLKEYGLIENEDYHFVLSENFLGISRDLVEGGKPNVYFYIVVDMDHNELNELLKERAKSDPSEPAPPNLKKGDENRIGLVKDGNLSKKLYLYKLDDVNFNYNYIMKMDMSKAVRVCRRRKYYYNNKNIFEKIECFGWNIKGIVHYHSDKTKMVWRRAIREFCKFFGFERKGLYEKECGEAFLGCLAFYRMCKIRIDEDYKSEKHKMEKKENAG